MVTIKNIKPTWKGKHRVNKIILAKSQKELTKYRINNRHKYKTIFYGSPNKWTGGAYALAQK